MLYLDSVLMKPTQLLAFLPFKKRGLRDKSRTKRSHQPEVSALGPQTSLNFSQNCQHRDAAHIALVVQHVWGRGDLLWGQAHLSANDLDNADAARVQSEGLERCRFDV